MRRRALIAQPPVSRARADKRWVAASCSSVLPQRFDETLAAWRGGQAFERIRAAWLDCALGLGERIAIENGAGKREGVFEGIDAAGRLLMRSEHGLESIEAADLTLSHGFDAPRPAALSASHAA